MSALIKDLRLAAWRSSWIAGRDPEMMAFAARNGPGWEHVVNRTRGAAPAGQLDGPRDQAMDPDDPDPGHCEDEPFWLREWRLPPLQPRHIDLTSHMRTFVAEAMQAKIAWQGNLTTSLWGRVRAIDADLSRQLATIMHHPDFQRLEGSWRGLRSLVDRTESHGTLRIQILDVCRHELSSEVDRVEICEQLDTTVFCQGDGELLYVLIGAGFPLTTDQPVRYDSDSWLR
jgi:hypothetical protein